jgi:hypothetical protein
MTKRIKAEDFKVDDPAETMRRFESLLGKLVQVPKSEIQEPPKPSTRKVGRKKRRA